MITAKPLRKLLLVTLTTAIGFWIPGLLAQTDETRFLRFIEGQEQWQGKLQSAIVSYENADGVELDLVAAIHIGEPEYYAQLNNYFQSRDVVLYELVAEPSARPVPGAARSGSPLSFLQAAMAGFLELDFQLDLVNYSGDNFRHADMSPAELQAVMAANNENFITMFIDLALAQIASEQQARAAGQGPRSPLTALSLLNALAADNQAQAIKYLFAREMGQTGGLLLTPELEAEVTLLADRNQVALEVLETTLNEGGATSLSLFYGAAHMPGLERGLVGDLGFKRTAVRWLDAWEIP